MTELQIREAVDPVRKNLEEVGANESLMYGSYDNADLDSIIRKTIPDAVNFINAAAPSYMLQGVSLLAERVSGGSLVSDYESLEIKGRVLRFSFGDRCLRIVAVRAFDSDVTISAEVPEVSPVGRMQINPFTRGTFDNPVLVRDQIGVNGNPTFTYYSLLAENSDFDLDTWLAQHNDDDREPFPLAGVEYMPFCEYEKGTLFHEAQDATEESFYFVPEQLKEAIVYQLTGMTLAIYGEDDKAKYFFSLNGLTSSSNE